MSDSQHPDPPLHDFIDMEAYDVVPAEQYRQAQEVNRDYAGRLEDALHKIDHLEDQLAARQELIEDIHAWFQGVAAEEGNPVFEIAERVEAFATSREAE